MNRHGLPMLVKRCFLCTAAFAFMLCFSVARATVLPTPAVTETALPISSAVPEDSAVPNGSASPASSPAPEISANPEPTPASTGMPSTQVNPFTGLIYTHSASHDGANILLGIDVSYHQGTILWDRVKASGVQFVFLRLGYRGYSTGTIALDKRFRSYAQEVTEAGLPMGVYFYTEAITETEAVQEANYCLEQMKEFDMTLPVVYDFEPTTNKTGRLAKAKLSKSKATSLCRAFCSTIQAAGYTPMIYANRSDLVDTIDGAELEKEYKIWLANYTKKPTYPGQYEFWQYSSSGKVDGITGEVDCNFWYFTNPVPEIEENEEKIDLAEAEIAPISNKVYSGNEKKPPLIVTYKDQPLIKDTDYTVSYSNNVELGKATVTITGINDYTGTASTSFIIKPKAVQGIEKIAISAKKTISLKWTIQKQVTGYVIYRKGALSGKYKKVATGTGAEHNYFQDNGRGVNRTFFYSVRAYIRVDGTDYYSPHSYAEAATNPKVVTQTVKKTVSLYQDSDLDDPENEKIITISDGQTVKHLGKVYITNGQFVYHVEYTKDDTTYTGYLPIDAL